MNEIAVACTVLRTGQYGVLHARKDEERTRCGRRTVTTRTQRWHSGVARPDQLTCKICREAEGLL